MLSVFGTCTINIINDNFKSTRQLKGAKAPVIPFKNKILDN
jgi:hypothetical protein